MKSNWSIKSVLSVKSRLETNGSMTHTLRLNGMKRRKRRWKKRANICSRLKCVTSIYSWAKLKNRKIFATRGKKIQNQKPFHRSLKLKPLVVKKFTWNLNICAYTRHRRTDDARKVAHIHLKKENRTNNNLTLAKFVVYDIMGTPFFYLIFAEGIRTNRSIKLFCHACKWKWAIRIVLRKRTHIEC